MFTDPLADMLTRVRNANNALLPEVEMPHSRLKEGVSRILKEQGYIQGFRVDGDLKKRLHLTLKYQGRKQVLAGLRRVSKPGLRKFVKATEVPKVLRGLGVAILSTPKGIMTGEEARQSNTGGEVLCYVW